MIAKRKNILIEKIKFKIMDKLEIACDNNLGDLINLIIKTIKFA